MYQLVHVHSCVVLGLQQTPQPLRAHRNWHLISGDMSWGSAFYTPSPESSIEQKKNRYKSRSRLKVFLNLGLNIQ